MDGGKASSVVLKLCQKMCRVLKKFEKHLASYYYYFFYLLILLSLFKILIKLFKKA